MTKTSNPGKITIIALIVLSIFSLRTINQVLRSNLQDFTYYTGAADNLLSGKDPYFSYPTQVYPPASLYLFIPFSLLPPQLSRTLWTSLSLISLFFALKIFSVNLYKKIPLAHIVLIFLASLQTFPVKYALAQGQINFLVFLCFALVFHFLSRKKDFLSGLFLAIAVSLKVNPLLLLPYFLLTKKTKLLPAFFISLLLLNLSIQLLFPIPLNNSFLRSVINMSTNYSGYYYNTSIAAVSIRLFDQSTAILFNLGLTSVIWLITFFATRLTKHGLLPYSIFLVAILLTSPITWQHYLFWSIPAFLYLIKLPRPKLTLLFTLLSFILINFNLKAPQLLSTTNPIYSHATLGTLILFSVLVFENQRIRRHPHHSVSKVFHHPRHS